MCYPLHYLPCYQCFNSLCHYLDVTVSFVYLKNNINSSLLKGWSAWGTTKNILQIQNPTKSKQINSIIKMLGHIGGGGGQEKNPTYNVSCDYCSPLQDFKSSSAYVLGNDVLKVNGNQADIKRKTLDECT